MSERHVYHCEVHTKVIEGYEHETAKLRAELAALREKLSRICPHCDDMDTRALGAIHQRDEAFDRLELHLSSENKVATELRRDLERARAPLGHIARCQDSSHDHDRWWLERCFPSALDPRRDEAPRCAQCDAGIAHWCPKKENARDEVRGAPECICQHVDMDGTIEDDPTCPRCHPRAAPTDPKEK